MWPEEHYGDGPPDTFSMCCKKGKVQLPLPELPDSHRFLRELFAGHIPSPQQPEHFFPTTVRTFFDNIRLFNYLFAMASVKADLKAFPTGVSQVRLFPIMTNPFPKVSYPHTSHCLICPPSQSFQLMLQGSLYSRSSPLLPQPGQEPRFGQIYILDQAAAEQQRAGMFEFTRSPIARGIVNTLNILFTTFNPLALRFKRIATFVRERINGGGPPPSNVTVTFNPDGRAALAVDGATAHPGTLNRPTANEVAAFVPANSHPFPLEVVVYNNNGRLNTLYDTDQMYNALRFPLFFPRGEVGWHLDLWRVQAQGEDRVRLTLQDWACFYLMSRCQGSPHLLQGRRLTEELMVDLYARIINMRLRYMKTQYNTQRRDTRNNIRAALHAAAGRNVTLRGANLGTEEGATIIPGNFTGSQKQMQQLHADAMAIVRNMGKPDLFITFTCNPK
jgi:hypothetical protein